MGDKKTGYGEGGWPLYKKAREQAEAQARERQFREDMARRKAEWDAGDITAAARATQMCVRKLAHELGIDADWLIDAARNLTVRALTEEEKRQRREWHIHQTRWEALTELLERGDELFAREPPPGEPRDDRGMKMESARIAVSEILEKTKAEGTDAAVKASYEIVNEAGGKDATFESYRAVVRARKQKKLDSSRGV